MIERDMNDAEAETIQEAMAASTNFSDAVERLQSAFQGVLTYNLRERSRLEAELAEVNARIAGLEK